MEARREAETSRVQPHIFTADYKNRYPEEFRTLLPKLPPVKSLPGLMSALKE
jgi:hypothetical protein